MGEKVTLQGQRTKVSVSVLLRSPHRGQNRASDAWSWSCGWLGAAWGHPEKQHILLTPEPSLLEESRFEPVS